MKLVYYKSAICPRCAGTNRLVARLRREHPEIEIQEIEVLTHLPGALQAGVHSLPTLIAGAQRFYSAPPMEELLTALQTGDKPAAQFAAA